MRLVLALIASSWIVCGCALAHFVTGAFEWERKTGREYVPATFILLLSLLAWPWILISCVRRRG